MFGDRRYPSKNPSASSMAEKFSGTHYVTLDFWKQKRTMSIRQHTICIAALVGGRLCASNWKMGKSTWPPKHTSVKASSRGMPMENEGFSSVSAGGDPPKDVIPRIWSWWRAFNHDRRTTITYAVENMDKQHLLFLNLQFNRQIGPRWGVALTCMLCCFFHSFQAWKL